MLQRVAGNRAAARVLARDPWAAATKPTGPRMHVGWMSIGSQPEHESLPPPQPELPMLGVRPAPPGSFEKAVGENLNEALLAAINALSFVNQQAKRDLSPSAAQRIARAEVDATLALLREALVTEALGTVSEDATAKRTQDKAGNLVTVKKRKRLKWKAKMDESFAEPIKAGLRTAIEQRIARDTTGLTKAKQYEQLRLQADLVKEREEQLKKLDKLAKKQREGAAGMATQTPDEGRSTTSGASAAALTFGAALPAAARQGRDAEAWRRGAALGSPPAPGAKAPGPITGGAIALGTSAARPGGDEESKLVKNVAELATRMAAESTLGQSQIVRNAAEQHRGTLTAAAEPAAAEKINQGFDDVRIEVQRKMDLLKLLAAAHRDAVSHADQLIIAAKATDIRIAMQDLGDRTHIQAIHGLAKAAAAAALRTVYTERFRQKAGEDLQRQLKQNPAQLNELRELTRQQVESTLADPAQAQAVIQQALDEYGKGALNGKLVKVASVLAGQAKEPGGRLNVRLTVRVPVDPTASAYVGFEIKADARRLQDQRLRLGMALTAIGGAKIPGVDVELMGKLGGYTEVLVNHDETPGGDDGEHAGRLLSYAFYRRFRESPVVPHELVDRLWGLKGRSARPDESKSKAQHREAELWGEAVEEEMREGEYASTGLLLGGRGSAKIGAGLTQLGVGGEAEIMTGTRYTKKFIEEERRRGKKKLGRGETTVKAAAEMRIGPLQAGAELRSSFLDLPRQGESRHLGSEARIFARGMVMKGALLGDPHEAAVRLATWIGAMGLLANKAIERADAHARDLRRDYTAAEQGKRVAEDARILKKGRKLILEPVTAAGAVVGGQWSEKHSEFERHQAMMENDASAQEVGGYIAGVPGTMAAEEQMAAGQYVGEAEQAPAHLAEGAERLAQGDVGGASKMQKALHVANVGGFVGPVFKPIGDLKAMLLDKEAGLSLDLNLAWGPEEDLSADIGLSYVKMLGLGMMDALKAVQVLDVEYTKSQPLLNYQFAPQRKFSWLFEDVDLAKVKQAYQYWGQYAAKGRPDAARRLGIRHDPTHPVHQASARGMLRF